MARADGRRDRGLKIAVGALPGNGHEHPARRLVDGDDGAIFVKNRDEDVARELDGFGFGHENLFELLPA